MPPSRRRAALNACGVAVLVLGLAAAGLVYGGGQKTAAAAPANGEWRDGSLSTEESKAGTRDVEMYYGQLGMFALGLRDKVAELGQSGPLAVIIAALATVVAAGCFQAARRAG